MSRADRTGIATEVAGNEGNGISLGRCLTKHDPRISVAPATNTTVFGWPLSSSHQNHRHQNNNSITSITSIVNIVQSLPDKQALLSMISLDGGASVRSVTSHGGNNVILAVPFRITHGHDWPTRAYDRKDLACETTIRIIPSASSFPPRIITTVLVFVFCPLLKYVCMQLCRTFVYTLATRIATYCGYCCAFAWSYDQFCHCDHLSSILLSLS